MKFHLYRRIYDSPCIIERPTISYSLLFVMEHSGRENRSIYTASANNYISDSMKGITPVIAIILLLLITISMVGFAFMWFTRMAETASQTGTLQLNQTIGQMTQRVRIDNINGNTLTIRNIGTQAISSSSLAFYVDNAQKGCDGILDSPTNDVDAFMLAAGEIKACYLCDELSGATCTAFSCLKDKRLKVSSPGSSDEVICP